MIPKYKIGDCSNPSCLATNTACVKVGKNLFCIKCRQTDRAMATIKKSESRFNKNLYASNKKEDLERVYLIEDLDFFVSQYVRKLNSSPNGDCECYTCNKIDKWKNMDCGHFMPRHHMALRWDLRNLRPQCKICNQFESGRSRDFARELEKEMPGIVNQLEQEAREIKKWSKDELKELLIDIRSKLKIVDNKFNNH